MSLCHNCGCELPAIRQRLCPHCSSNWVPTPTLAEIRARCRQIQNTWRPAVEQQRCSQPAVLVRVKLCQMFRHREDD